MSEVRLLDLADAPQEGEGKRVAFEHPYTDFPYVLGVYYVKDRYFVITDICKKCNSSLTQGKVNGKFALCAREGHAWQIKTGLYKFDRTQCIPTYRVTLKDEGLYIEI